MELPKHFDHATQEPLIYQHWLKAGAFTPKAEGAAESRSILMPPPNANGLLHVGHAYEVAIQDAFIRYWRMQGYKTLWQPGTDHAGFETQIVFEKKLEKEGRTRFGMDRQRLFDEIFAFSKENQNHIRAQLERLGASCDWSRFWFMLDAPLVSTVYKTFKTLYEDGLIYRAKRPVNWCTKHQTTLSDLEVKEEERVDPLYYLRYGPLTVATVRPETTFGDVAIAVNPHDDRYKSYLGQSVEVEMADTIRSLPVIADTYVNPEFGTGAVKITPAHDPNDFEVAERHHLPLKEVIDHYGKLTDAAGPYAGMKVSEAREKIVAALEARGLVEKIDTDYSHNVKVCYKCGTVIEPRVLDQWWLALTKTSKSGKNLRDLAVAAVKAGQVKFITERFENQFYRWMENLRDWPLSRQIVWGIQIPVWYNPAGEVIVTEGEAPEGDDWTRDQDVFDTWFSSCQWPFSTLGNNNATDLETFYPTTAMMPGYDLIFFWVSRMLMLSLYTQEHVPYQVIYLHGLVRDKDRQKMSKSKGNTMDPLAVVEQYGTDALRGALLFGSAPGSDVSISEEKIRGMRNFTTKIWNIARYIQMNCHATTKAEFIPVTDADHAIKSTLEKVSQSVTLSFENYNLHLALEVLYQFVWHDLADVYIERAKDQLANESTKLSTQANLLSVLLTTLRLLHPLYPFVTEAIWQQLALDSEPLIMQAWPRNNAG